MDHGSNTTFNSNFSLSSDMTILFIGSLTRVSQKAVIILLTGGKIPNNKVKLKTKNNTNVNKSICHH